MDPTPYLLMVEDSASFVRPRSYSQRADDINGAITIITECKGDVKETETRLKAYAPKLDREASTYVMLLRRFGELLTDASSSASRELSALLAEFCGSYGRFADPVATKTEEKKA